jgi:penicillin-binding protein 1C
MFKIHFFKKKIILRCLLFCISIGVIFFLSFYIFPLPKIPSYSTLVIDKNNKVVHSFLSNDDKWRFKTTFSEIPQPILKAFLAKEDKYFFYHPGVNLLALMRAFINNTFQWKKTSGASTITMQVARLLEPRKRNYVSKIIEMYRALQLEYFYTKEEIFELYMNLIPYGGNIEGIKAAALVYYEKDISQLSLSQITCLTIIPNRPNSLNPAKGEKLLTYERNKWLRRFYSEHIFDSLTIEDAIIEPNSTQRHRLPKYAPHLSYYLKKIYCDSPIIKTTLSLSTQLRVELLMENYMNRLRNLQINNCAIYILNNQTNSVEAYIGSNQFNDTEHQGQVNGIRAIRSPGSTLKPFIYGIAMDKGILTPKFKIEDIPTNFDGYAPNNFDMEFHGLVSVEQSLAYSLNVPAVKVLDIIGVKTFSDFLLKAGCTSIEKNQKNLGLSLALGGCGVRLEELTHLYTIFSKQGNLVPYAMVADDTASYSIPLLSEGAAFMITEILQQITRPDLPHNVKNSFHIPSIAWKTGTSYGRKDAWSIGYNPKYTIGVWIGNFTGEGVHELTGADMATPLLFHIFNTLDYNSQASYVFKPKEIQQRLVCPISGQKQGEQCPEGVLDYFIPGISNPLPCQHLKNIFISPDESFSYCSHCLPDNGYKIKAYTQYSPGLENFYRLHHIPHQKAPQHNPLCTHALEYNAPKIISPIHRKEYLIEATLPSDIKLQAIASRDVKKIYWYIDHVFYKECSNDESVFFTPKKGTSKIQCVDDQGRSSTIEIQVDYY